MSFDLFQGPIPGQSLTQGAGSAPHDLPPQFSDVNDALEHIFELLTQPRQATRLILMLKKGVPAEYIARSILFIGFAKGKWTPDVALMALRVVMSQIIAIAQLKGIKVKVFNADKEQDAFLDQFLDMSQEPSGTSNTSTPTDNTQLPQFKGILGGNV